MADRIRKINSQTTDVHVVVKTGDQLPATASIWGLAASPNGNVYTCDMINSVVYKVFEQGRVSGAIVGKLTTPGDVPSSGLYGSDGNVARLYLPWGICVDSSENIYVSDAWNNKVKRLSPSGRCQTLAGTGVDGDVCSDNGLLAQFSRPGGICVDSSGIIYVCDTGNHKIKKIWPSGKVTLLAGSTVGYANGQGSSAKFYTPSGICINKSRKLFVMDTGNYKVRQVDEDGNVVTLAGAGTGYVDGVGSVAQFATAWDICVENSGVIWVVDMGNSVIRRILDNGKVSTFMPMESTTINSASAITVDNSGFLYFIEGDGNNEQQRN